MTDEINPDLLPIRLDPASKKFEAGGHTYYIEHNLRLSVARDRWLEKFGLFAILGRDGMAFLQEARRAYDANNDSRPGDVAVILDNLMKGAAEMRQKEAPLYYVCTLFINRKDEDRRTYDEQLGRQKIDDWQTIERDFFLSLGLSFLTITGQQLSELMATISNLNLPELSLNEPNLSDQ